MGRNLGFGYHELIGFVAGTGTGGVLGFIYMATRSELTPVDGMIGIGIAGLCSAIGQVSGMYSDKITRDNFRGTIEPYNFRRG